MSEPTLYNQYGWQSDLVTFTKIEAKVVRNKLNDFISDAST